MNRRSNKILRALVLGNRQNVMELVSKYNVQERTIRADIKELNIALQEHGLPSIASAPNGDLSIKSENKIDVRAYEQFVCDHTFYTYYLSKNERSTILAMILLNANGYVTVDQLKEIIGVSRNTLLRDIPELKKWVDENKMEFVSQVRRGYLINASEIVVRKSILKLFEVNGDDSDYETGYHLGAFWNLLVKQMDKMNVYEDIKKTIIRQEETLQSFLSDYSFFEAIFELTLIINRVAHHQALTEFYSETPVNLKESSKYIFSSNILGELGEKYNLEIPECEVLYFTECLKRKSYIKDKYHKNSALDVRLMIAETLYQVSNSFGIDFYLDFALYDLLVAHMRSAVYRIQMGEVLKNPLKDSLLKEYPEIFERIRENIGALEEYIGGKFSEDELSFMVLYFASVLEKEKAESTKHSKVKIALVCETGRGTAQFMLAKLHALDDMIEVVSVSSVHNATEIKNSSAEMIISTIPLEECDLPCVVVRSAMLSKDDLLDIQRIAFEVIEENVTSEDMFNFEIDNSYLGDIQGAFYNLLSEDCIELNYEAKDWEDAVREAGRLLCANGAVEEQYVDAMVDNIKENGPYIVIWPGTALPHAESQEGVVREAAALVRLKNPVTFHHEMNDPVRYVIAISILSAESINQALYDIMIIFGNERIKQILDMKKDEKSILEAINSLKTVG